MLATHLRYWNVLSTRAGSVVKKKAICCGGDRRPPCPRSTIKVVVLAIVSAYRGVIYVTDIHELLLYSPNDKVTLLRYGKGSVTSQTARTRMLGVRQVLSRWRAPLWKRNHSHAASQWVVRGRLAGLGNRRLWISFWYPAFWGPVL